MMNCNHNAAATIDIEDAHVAVDPAPPPAGNKPWILLFVGAVVGVLVGGSISTLLVMNGGATAMTGHRLLLGLFAGEALAPRKPKEWSARQMKTRIKKNKKDLAGGLKELRTILEDHRVQNEKLRTILEEHRAVLKYETLKQDLCIDSKSTRPRADSVTGDQSCAADYGDEYVCEKQVVLFDGTDTSCDETTGDTFMTACCGPTPTWIQLGTDIDGEAAGDYSGWSVAFSKDGTVLAVGATGNDDTGNFAGHVRVYKWSDDNAGWVQRGTDINGEAAGDYSVRSVALSDDGTILAVGAPFNDGAGNVAGHVRVYKWGDDNAGWVQRGTDINGEAAGDNSGTSVALSEDGTVLAVGARYNDGAGINAGHVRVYKWGDDNAGWVQRGIDINGEAVDDWSGYSVALSDDGTVLAVGAIENQLGNLAGHVRVYVWDDDNAGWAQRGTDINGKAAGDWSGKSVALSNDGTVLAVGAMKNDGAGIDAGHVRVYDWDAANTVWLQRGADINGEEAGDESGFSVALSGNGTVLVVGAPYNDDNGNDAGHVRVYKWD